jgi:hypothetical protein
MTAAQDSIRTPRTANVNKHIDAPRITLLRDTEGLSDLQQLLCMK